MGVNLTQELFAFIFLGSGSNGMNVSVWNSHSAIAGACEKLLYWATVYMAKLHGGAIFMKESKLPYPITAYCEMCKFPHFPMLLHIFSLFGVATQSSHLAYQGIIHHFSLLFFLYSH